MPLKVLDRPLVLSRLFQRAEGTEITAFARLLIFLSRIQPILTGFEFANHAWCDAA